MLWSIVMVRVDTLALFFITLFFQFQSFSLVHLYIFNFFAEAIFPLVSRMFTIAGWNICIATAFKSSSDPSNICVISALTSVDCPSLWKLSWFFIIPQRNPIPIRSYFPFPLFSGLVLGNLLSTSVNFPIMNILHSFNQDKFYIHSFILYNL